mgnify:CR=1 FL=1
MPILVVILKEYMRSIICDKYEDSTILYIFTFTMFVMLDLINLVKPATFGSAEGLFLFLALTLLPAISNNIAANYIAKKSNYKVNIFWLLIWNMYGFILPIIPNTGDYILSIIKLILPFTIYFRMKSFFEKEKDKEISRDYNKRQILPYVITAIIVSILVYFTCGHFRYYAVAIASGSMEPNISRGDVVIIDQKYELENLEKGQIMAYKYKNVIVEKEYEEGTIYQDHCVTLGNIDNSGETILDASNELLELNEQLQKTHTALFNIMLGISKFDINKYLEQQEKPKKRLFKKEELNNREMLFEIFLNLLSINGLKTYIEEIYGNSDNSVNLNEAFNKYFNKKYGEETLYVEPYTFINDFREVVALCYKDKLEDIMNKINIQNIKINSNTTLMCDNIRIGMNQASLQKEIREQYPAKRDELMIIGFTMEELERIYTNLKEFIGNGFSFGTDDEELFLRKV